MREKSRTFRSLLLESLEHRTVFAADGFVDMWQVEYRDSHTAITYLQDGRAQISAIIVGSNATVLVNDPGRGHGQGGLKFRTLPDDLRGEGESFVAFPHGNPGDSASQPGATHKPDVTAQPKPPTLLIDVPSLGSPTLGSPNLGSPVLGLNLLIPNPNFDGPRVQTPVSNPTPPSSPTSNFGNNGSVSPGNSHGGGQAGPLSTIASTISQQNNSTSASNFAALNSDASSSPISGSSQATFDFSANGSHNQNSVAQHSVLDSSSLSDSSFRFSAASTKTSGKVFDAELVEQKAGIASLETLLSDLAERHRQSRSEQTYDANRPNLRFATPRDLPAEAADAVARTFAEGGLIALALNRDIGSQDLAEMAAEVNRENRTWIANVGIYREFENAAIVATEVVAAPVRSLRDATASQSDLTQAEAEVSDSQLHPLLASSTALVAAMLFSLRRVRKNVRLMYTKR